MGHTKIVFSVVLVISSFFLLLALSLASSDAYSLKSCMIDSIYQLGASKSDTGNFIRESLIGAASPFARLPYGETFFNMPTGRCSDGLLMIDYIAMAAGLPFLNPFLKKDSDFSGGVNFAVAGSTALTASFLAANNIPSPLTNSSLDVQLGWMISYFNSICMSHTDCAEMLQRAVVFVGEIGGNDFNYAFFQARKTIDEAMSIVPDIVGAVMGAVRKIIEIGAVRVVVPGNFPIGCFPTYLTAFQTNNSAAYDQFQCLKVFNDLASYYNDRLQQAINQLGQENPNSTILYGDSYNAFLWVLQNAQILGFDVASVQKACCGVGGDYNFNFNAAKFCGSLGVPICPNPNLYINWDGIHVTQQANKFMTEWFIRDILPKIHCVI